MYHKIHNSISCPSGLPKPNVLSSKSIDEIKKLCSNSDVLTDKVSLDKYSKDWLKDYQSNSVCIVIPRNIEGIKRLIQEYSSNVVDLANKTLREKAARNNAMKSGGGNSDVLRIRINRRHPSMRTK